jgi:hypothetical protein
MTVRRTGSAIWKTAVFSLILVSACGCNLFRFSLVNTDRDAQTAASPAPLPHKYQQKVSQFVLISDFEFVDPPLFKELTRLHEDVHHELKLPSARIFNPIQVYLFENRDQYERFMRSQYPDLPMRRAFFVAQPRGVGGGDDLLVYTFLGDHLRQDLRHELTHAMLHSVLKDVPLWLDEGLAEYFELPPEAHGVNRAHLALIRREGIQPRPADAATEAGCARNEFGAPRSPRQSLAMNGRVGRRELASAGPPFRMSLSFRSGGPSAAKLPTAHPTTVPAQQKARDESSRAG